MIEILEKKLKEIRDMKVNATANLHALEGAEQVLIQLIAENKDVVTDENDNG